MTTAVLELSTYSSYTPIKFVRAMSRLDPDKLIIVKCLSEAELMMAGTSLRTNPNYFRVRPMVRPKEYRPKEGDSYKLGRVQVDVVSLDSSKLRQDIFDIPKAVAEATLDVSYSKDGIYEFYEFRYFRVLQALPYKYLNGCKELADTVLTTDTATYAQLRRAALELNQQCLNVYCDTLDRVICGKLLRELERAFLALKISLKG